MVLTRFKILPETNVYFNSMIKAIVVFQNIMTDPNKKHTKYHCKINVQLTHQMFTISTKKV